MSAATHIKQATRKANRSKPVKSKKRIGKHRQYCPANDVSYTVNCPVGSLTYFKLAPQPLQFCSDATDTIKAENKRAFRIAISEQLSKRMALVNQFYKAGFISDDKLREGIAALKQDSTELLMDWVSGVYSAALTSLNNSIMSECEQIVLALPHGQQIWEALLKQDFYCFYIDESSSSTQLRYRATDFFSHYDIGLSNVNDELKSVYVDALSKLMLSGDGAWQNYVNCYGHWDFVIPKTVEELKILEDFINEFGSVDIEQASAFMVGYKTPAIDSFIESVAESYWNSLDEIIDSEDSESLDCFKERAAECLEYVKAEFACENIGINKESKSWEALLKAVEGKTGELAEVLKAVFQQGAMVIDENAETQTLACNVMSYVEETHPGFGIIVCPFAPDTPQGEAMYNLSEMAYNEFMESGEFEDDWIIDTGHEQWLDIVKRRTHSTVLLMAVIIGCTEVIFKAD